MLNEEEVKIFFEALRQAQCDKFNIISNKIIITPNGLKLNLTSATFQFNQLKQGIKA